MKWRYAIGTTAYRDKQSDENASAGSARAGDTRDDAGSMPGVDSRRGGMTDGLCTRESRIFWKLRNRLLPFKTLNGHRVPQ